MSKGCSEDPQAEMFARNTAAVSKMEGAVAPPRAYAIPGRIEVLGKHTDYAGGSTLVAAIERAICMVAAPRDDRMVVIRDTALGETARFTIEGTLEPERGRWPNYPMTVARRIARNFPWARRGANIAFSSNLPPAAGISSSSALVIGIFFALGDANRLWTDERFPEELRERANLSGYLGSVENGQSYGTLAGDRGVGTFGGSSDHTAILCSRPGRIVEYSYCPVRFQRSFRMPDGYVFAVASSGVVADKTGGAAESYNRASRLASRVAELWRRETGREDANIAAALASSPDAKQRLRSLTTNRALRNRLEHFLVENEDVLPGACEALAKGDIEAFGSWVDRSQRAAERLLGNQVPETIFLASSARKCGAPAASAFGAGFGGSVWALVGLEDSERFLEEWRERYEAVFPKPAKRSEFFLTATGDPMSRLP